MARYRKSFAARRPARGRARAYGSGRNRSVGMRSARSTVRRGNSARRYSGRGRTQTVRIVIDNTAGSGGAVPGAENVGLVRAGLPRRAPF